MGGYIGRTVTSFFLESKKMQRMLRRMISLQYGISVEIPINGDMDGFKRKKIVDSFNAYNGFNVLILSPIAEGRCRA